MTFISIISIIMIMKKCACDLPEGHWCPEEIYRRKRWKVSGQVERVYATPRLAEYPLPRRHCGRSSVTRLLPSYQIKMGGKYPL